MKEHLKKAFRGVPYVCGSLGAAMLASCAMMIDGLDQNVQISSVPEGASAEIYEGTKSAGGMAKSNQTLRKGTLVTTITTPAQAVLSRKCDYVVVLKKHEYAPKEAPLCRNSWGNWWVLGDIVFLIGAPIDALSGAQNAFDPQYNYALGSKSETLICRPTD